jgi:hypothetical protein
MLNAIQEAQLKGKSTRDALQMTDVESDRIGQMFRLQLPIVREDARAALKAQAKLLRRLADKFDQGAAGWTEPDFRILSALKYEVALVNNLARRPRYWDGEKSGEADA